MPSRPIVIRVMGIIARDVKEAETVARRAINQQLQDDEEDVFPRDITASPCCDDHRRDLFIALVDFVTLPRFLSSLAPGPGSVKRKYVAELEFDREFLGFTQLYPNKSTPIADLVFITGIGGHSYGSWAAKEEPWHMWPRHFLSEDLPNVRTMTYGYDTRLLRLGFGKLSDYAREFTSALHLVRSRDLGKAADRPIVFVAHSFGGNLLKMSLVKSLETNRDLLRATRGILFFAVPHRGMDLEDMLSVLNDGHEGRDFLQEINQWTDLLDSFRNVISGIKIISFYETQTTRGLVKNIDGSLSRSGKPIALLRPENATLGLPDDQEKKCPVSQDHSVIVKFEHRHVHYYKIVLRDLEDVIRQAHRPSASIEGSSAALLQGPIPEIQEPRPQYLEVSGDDTTSYEQKQILRCAPNLAMKIISKATAPDHSSTSQSELTTRSTRRIRDDVQLLTMLVDTERLNALQILLRHEVDADKIRPLPKEYIELKFENHTATKETVLILASSLGISNLVAHIIDKGVNINARDKSGRTSLMWAARNNHPKTVEVLVQKGSYIEAQHSHGSTALITATSRGYAEIVKILAKHGATIDSRDESGWTPLNIAADKGLTEVVQVLLSYGADIEAQDRRGWRPLSNAANIGHVEIVQILLNNKAQIEAKNGYGSTALSIAARNGYVGVCQVLLESGANAVTRNRNGYTPIDIAAAEGHKSIVKLLRDRQFRTHERDKADNTLQVSKRRKDESLSTRSFSLRFFRHTEGRRD